MSEFVSFLWAIEAQPDDPLPKLAFADWLDERGDPRGACLRWVVSRGVRPVHDTVEDTWDWWKRPPREPDYYPGEDVPSAVVPANLFCRLKGERTDIWKGYPSYVAALGDLMRAWKRCALDGIDPIRNGE